METVEVFVIDPDGAVGVRVVATAVEAFVILDCFAHDVGGVAVYATGEPIGIAGADTSFLSLWSDDELNRCIAENVSPID